MIERRGENINVRHILMIPKASPADMIKSKKDIDKIAALIKSDSITFVKAATLFSDDPSRVNGGMLINPYTGDSKFSPDEIDPNVFFIIEKMKVGDISEPMIFTNEDGQQAYRMLMLKSRTEPHKANLKDDYPQIQNLALQLKQNQAINKWIDEKSQAPLLIFLIVIRTANSSTNGCIIKINKQEIQWNSNLMLKRWKRWLKSLK